MLACQLFCADSHSRMNISICVESSSQGEGRRVGFVFCFTTRDANPLDAHVLQVAYQRCRKAAHQMYFLSSRLSEAFTSQIIQRRLACTVDNFCYCFKVKWSGIHPSILYEHVILFVVHSRTDKFYFL